MALFAETDRVKEGVEVINVISSTKLGLILHRIIDKLHTQDEEVFSEEEMKKLTSSLKLTNSNQLDLLLSTCRCFLSQAAYHVAKPAVLAQNLVAVGVLEQKVHVFQEVWLEKAKPVLERLRKQSFAPNQLESVNWQLNLQLSQKTRAKQKSPSASFEFGIRNSDARSSQDVERIQVEFDHGELYRFFDQLNTIQAQLDGLS